MQNLLVAVLTVAACVGASTAKGICSEQCLDMVLEARREDDPDKFGKLYDEVINAGCERCYQYLYHTSLKTAAPAEDEPAIEEGGSARTNTEFHSRKSAGHPSRLAAARHRNNHH